MNTVATAVLQGMERSNQGGLVHRADDELLLDRFLIKGTFDGTFYVGGFDNTKNAHEMLERLYARNHQKVLDRIVEISDAGRAPSNSPALFALAVGAAYKGDNMENVRRDALAVLPQVARTGTHLFEFAGYAEAARGWGTGLKKGIRNWYFSQEPRSLAYGVTKYAQREGWSHRDLLRLSHPKADALLDDYNGIFNYVVNGNLEKFRGQSEAREYLEAVEEAKASKDPNRVVELIQTYRLPREVLPTEMLKEQVVWEALLYAPMPVMAAIRNAGTLHRRGLIDGLGSDGQRFYVDLITNPEAIRKSRIHPFDAVKASLAYSGRGVYDGRLGNVISDPSPIVVDALDEAAELAFGNITPTGKSFMQGIDVSGSMSWRALPNLPVNSAMAAAYMAYQTVRVERYVETYAFSTYATRRQLPKSGGMFAVMNALRGLPMAGTDIPLVIDVATRERYNVDVFAIYTDSENGNRNRAATHSLAEYRNKVNADAKLVIISTEYNQWSNSGNLPNTLEVAGFDTAVPRIVSEFALGNV
jgi:60 kDa SS-A/Ro ribonucleoprotein